MDLGLKTKVALVTGGSGGVGAAVARSLAEEGASVAIGYHARRDAAEELAQEIDHAGGTAMTVGVDLAAADTARTAVDGILSAWGHLDILVCCAWVHADWPKPDRPDTQLSSPESWRDQLGINAEGTARTVQAVLEPMKENGWGRIVLISSGAAEEGQPGLEAYAAAKASLHALNLSLARGLGRAGILSNVVVPGFIATARNRRFVPSAAFEQWAARTPTGKLATEEDVASVVTFLASAANRSVTGVAVRVSGGL